MPSPGGSQCRHGAAGCPAEGLEVLAAILACFGLRVQLQALGVVYPADVGGFKTWIPSRV